MLSRVILVQGVKTLFIDVWRVYFTLLKVMVPAIIAVKLLDMMGDTVVSNGVSAIDGLSRFT